MSPVRLDPDQRLLYEVLNEIWNRETARVTEAYAQEAAIIREAYARHSRRLMVVVALIASIATGITLGAVYQMRISLRQTAAVIRRLEERGDMDRELLLHASKEQEEAAHERYALQSQLARLKRQVVVNESHVAPATTLNNHSERRISNRRYERKKPG